MPRSVWALGVVSLFMDVLRWRCRDVQERIAREFAVSLHERTVGKLLHKLRFRRLSVRPHHPESDPTAQAAFKGASPSW